MKFNKKILDQIKIFYINRTEIQPLHDYIKLFIVYILVYKMLLSNCNRMATLHKKLNYFDYIVILTNFYLRVKSFFYLRMHEFE